MKTPRRQIIKFKDSRANTELDFITEEEPLEISITIPCAKPKIYKKSISITMRTPGADLELALGFLHSEGIITDRKQILDNFQEENKINLVLDLVQGFDLSKLDRHFYTSSSCGVCGKASIDALKVQVPERSHSPIAVTSSVLKYLPGKLREAQRQFEATGGIHAAALFDVNGNLKLSREDVGRHNALDKLIGAVLLDKEMNASDCILLLSGRISFELVHKAAVAGISCVAAIGAPSTLAIETAEEFGITLIGFLKTSGFNIYNGVGRVS